MKLPKIQSVRRLDYILDNCRGKDVLHLGCASSPSTRARFKMNELLHVQVGEEAAALWGVDMDREQIEYLKDKGVPNLFVGDVEKLTETGLPGNKKFDVILAGELIEHLGNPALFLRQCVPFLKPDGYLIVSTVNAFTIKRAPRVFFRVEATAPDHTFYSTYSTLHQLFDRASFGIEDIRVYYMGRDLYVNQPLISRLSGAFLERLPVFNYFADGFVLKAVRKK